MAAFNKFQQFPEDLAKQVHDLDNDDIRIMLSNSAPSAANAVAGDITEISAGNGYSAGGAAVPNPSCEQSAGTMSFKGDQVVFTASGGSIGPFRYAVLYNATPGSPLQPLIGWWDYGSSISIPDGASFTVKPSGSASAGTMLSIA